jgi:hypothetical protein
MSGNLVIAQDNGLFAVLAASDDGFGLLTLHVTTATPNSALFFRMPNGRVMRIATVLAGGVHTLAVQSV